MCIDPTELNKALIRDHGLVPTFDETRAKLVNKILFSVIDMKKGVFSMLNSTQNQRICARLAPPFGFYKFERPSFGIGIAPKVFLKLNRKYFGKYLSPPMT